VGKASNLRERAKQYWSDEEENEGLKKHIKCNDIMKFSSAEVGKESDRDGIEAYRYLKYNTSDNGQEPQADPIPVNTPEVRGAED
jgi:hypothetical protein